MMDYSGDPYQVSVVVNCPTFQLSARPPALAVQPPNELPVPPHPPLQLKTKRSAPPISPSPPITRPLYLEVTFGTRQPHADRYRTAELERVLAFLFLARLATVRSVQPRSATVRTTPPPAPNPHPRTHAAPRPASSLAAWDGRAVDDGTAGVEQFVGR